MDHQRDQGVEGGHRETVADVRPLDAQCVRLARDALTGGTVDGDSAGERAGTIHQHASATSRLIIALLLTAVAFQDVLLLAGVAGGSRKQERTTRTLSLRAVRVSTAEGRCHASPTGTPQHPIRITSGCDVSVEGNGSHAPVAGSGIRDRPGSRGGISGQVGGVPTSETGLLGKRTDGRDIPVSEGVGDLSQHDITVVRGGSGAARAVAPETFFLLSGGAISAFFGAAACDAQRAVGIASQACGRVGAIGDGGAWGVFFDPGAEMRDIEGDERTETRNGILEGVNRASTQSSE